MAAENLTESFLTKKVTLIQKLNKGQTITAQDAETFGIGGSGIGWNNVEGLKPPVQLYEDHVAIGLKHPHLPQG